MMALIKKELRIYIASPIFSVTAGLFLFMTGYAFTIYMTQASPRQLPEASIRGMIYFMSILLLFMTPFLTMRSFSEEKKTGTIELLKTSPLSDFQILAAKYLSVLSLFVILLVLTFEFPVFIFLTGKPDMGPMILSYLGLFLLGASLAAIGLFMSLLTKSQMLAAILTFIFALFLWFLADTAGEWGSRLSLIHHLDSFSLGVVDTADLFYFILVIFVFLFLSLRVMESERWK